MRHKKLNSLLLVINEEYLSKGFALALLDYFQSIHTTRNPYEALEMLSKKEIDVLISNVNFKTIDADSYLNSLTKLSKNLKSIILIKDAPIQLSDIDPGCDIIVKDKSVSIKSIIESIKNLKNITS
jgi:DNA-binding NtrC family response regulator